MGYSRIPCHLAEEITSYILDPNFAIRKIDYNNESWFFSKDVSAALGYNWNRLSPSQRGINHADCMYFKIFLKDTGVHTLITAINARGITDFLYQHAVPDIRSDRVANFIKTHGANKNRPAPTPKPNTSERPLSLTEKCTMECMKEHADKHAEENSAEKNCVEKNCVEKNCVEKNCVEQHTSVEPSIRSESAARAADAVAHHKAICTELNELYARKNNDYGDSFHLSFIEEGMAMARIRLGDKLNRFKTLTKDPSGQNVKDESVRDTLIDLANYAIMTVMEMDRAE